MIKRPQKNETLEDILRQHEEFNQLRHKKPNLKLAASVVQTESATNAKKSVFARSRAHDISAANKTAPLSAEDKFINNEIYENMLGVHKHSEQANNLKLEDRPKIVLGDVCERAHVMPVVVNENNTTRNKSIFVQNIEAMQQTERKTENLMTEDLAKQAESAPVFKKHLKRVYGEMSTIVEDPATSKEIRDMNVTTLSDMSEEDILAKRTQLINDMDADLVKFLIKRRQQQKPQSQHALACEASNEESMNVDVEVPALQENNPAMELLKRSQKEQWLHFDVIEPHKLHWLHDLPKNPIAQLKPSEQYEARFDWKGILLPYTYEAEKVEEKLQQQHSQHGACGNNELFLHGDEEHRPGYTIQELFRLARSDVQQQRVAAFEALAGMLSIHQQGFFDGVLELPISKIFFLLRYGLDDNACSMLRVTSKALAALFYNDSDETLLDYYYDNPHYHRQPSLPVSEIILMGKPMQDADGHEDDDDFEALENLQKQMSKLNTKPKHMVYSMNVKQQQQQKDQETSAAAEEHDEEENKMTMSDFELAEKDLIDCLVRTNILQRIWYILNIPQQENDIVSSCLKILIRMARTSSEVAAEIIKNQQLINSLNIYATMEASSPNSNNPQVLCLKLFRVLFTHGDLVACKLLDIFKLDNILEKYLLTFDWRTLKENTLRVQLESLRILRQLVAQQVDPSLINRKYGNALRYILGWHYKNTEINVDAPYLLRQHAAAVLSVINMNFIIYEIKCGSQLANLINDCCCKWFYRATNHAIKEFSQSTLLAVCLEAVTLCIGINENICDFTKFLTDYLSQFLTSNSFIELCKTCINNSILLNAHNDRRHAHKPLPNVGAVIQHASGPQLIVGQNYPMHLLNALWALMESQRDCKNILQSALFGNSHAIKLLLQYLGNLQNKCFNQLLATNYFAMAELTLIPQLLSMDAVKDNLHRRQIYFIAYRVLCSFSHDHIRQILKLYREIIFNKKYLNVKSSIIKIWHDSYIKLLIHDESTIECFDVNTAAVNAFSVPLLPMDWPYYHLRVILLNQLNNVQQITKNTLAEREAIEMTLRFTREIEFCETISATQQLMYLMIMFMGPNSAYQEKDISTLIRENLLRFYEKYKTHTFQLDIKFFGMSHFEDLYFMFVDHFQASSYGNDLFSSLVMLPLAQRYPDKWRKRIWSDFSGALYCLQCSEDMLIGGLDAYLEPAEEDESLLISYAQALSSNPRPSRLLCKIATYHVRQWKIRLAQKSLQSTNQIQ